MILTSKYSKIAADQGLEEAFDSYKLWNPLFKELFE
jgi:hypothetical protein